LEYFISINIFVCVGKMSFLSYLDTSVMLAGYMTRRSAGNWKKINICNKIIYFFFHKFFHGKKISIIDDKTGRWESKKGSSSRLCIDAFKQNSRYEKDKNVFLAAFLFKTTTKKLIEILLKWNFYHLSANNKKIYNKFLNVFHR